MEREKRGGVTLKTVKGGGHGKDGTGEKKVGGPKSQGQPGYSTVFKGGVYASEGGHHQAYSLKGGGGDNHSERRDDP